MFGRAANERPSFEKKKQIQLVTLIKESVTKLCEPERLQLRDWSLDPDLLLDAQDMYHAATVEAWPRGEKAQKWLDPNDEPTPTHAGSYIMATRSGWLSRHFTQIAYRTQGGGGMPSHPLLGSGLSIGASRKTL